MGLLRHLKQLVRVPAFTGLAVVTLAIGIGANVAIFSVIEGVLLKPLPFHDADQLVDIDHAAPGVNVPHAGAASFLYFTYRDDAKSFQRIGMWRSDTYNLNGVGEPEEVRGMEVTEDVTSMLGIQPSLGRLFSQNDDSSGSTETVVLSHEYWLTKFGGDRSWIGRTILLDGRAREIIGVMPAGFRFLEVKPAVVLPMRLDRKNTRLGGFNYSGIARLKPGVSLAEATADLSRLIPVAIHRFPAFEGYSTTMFEQARLTPAVLPLKQRFVGDISSVLWLLMGSVGVVLLIACANVANLMLVRAEGRQQELAIRAALGANRGRLVRELLIESLTLSAVAGVVGVGLAYGALEVLRYLAPHNLPRLDDIAIDPKALAFAVVISIIAGLLFGAIPALRQSGLQLTTPLRAGGRTMSQSRERRRARSALVVAQIALALVLLISSGLMIRTFRALRDVQPGFSNPEQLQTVRVYIPESEARDALAVIQTERQMMEKLAAIPGVTSVGTTTAVPLDGDTWHDPIFAADRVYAEGTLPPVRLFKFVSPGMSKTMGGRVVAGREFTWTDALEKRPVVLVSENLATELWGGPSAALGKRIRENPKAPWREVVGVMGDEHHDGVNKPAPEIVFWPLMMGQFGDSDTFVRRSLAYVLRTDRAGSSSLIREIGQAVWSVNPRLPLASVRTMKEIADRSMAQTSFTLVMLAIAGGMALLLGITGIYGVISYSVSQRTREIGVRMALGAQVHQVTRMFLAYGFRLAVIGIAAGVVASFAVTRLLTSLLFAVSPNDPWTYAIVSLGLVGAAALASYVPALRATAVNPVEALRAE
jgi:putative ABC transport system permease protein